jgi:CRP-like cAMP-binding protein
MVGPAPDFREKPMNDPRYDALRSSRLAAELDDAQCRTLSALTELRDLADGEVLVREGSADDHLFVVISGALGVVRHPQGEPPVTLHTLVAGDFAGELSFIDDTERYASLQAELRSGDRLPRHAGNRAHRPCDPAAALDPVGRTRQLHLQAARSLLRRSGQARVARRLRADERRP